MKEKDIDDILDEIVKLRENKLAWVGLIRWKYLIIDL
jgi:hypothetical protein